MTAIAVSQALREIRTSRDMVDISADSADRSLATGSRMGAAAKLCASMFRNFEDPGRDRVVLANFLRWASDPMPGRQNGVNFKNEYFAIYAEDGGVGKLVCLRDPKGHSRNCYTSIPVAIHFRLPDASVFRMRLFLCTTFARQGASLGILLSYMALVAASGRLPEIMIVFFGPGGEGETLLLCDLMSAVWGTGHSVAPRQSSKLARSFGSRDTSTEERNGFPWTRAGQLSE